MKRLLSLLVLLATVSWSAWADETITVTANSEDISQALDLKAVATLFGTVKNVEEFETLLNNPDSAFTNLDLNGDGVVDYLRVVETSSGNKHLVVIQAVLAKDVFQDVASIYVEKDESTGQVTTQVIGDEYIYGTNYIIEPVYIYRPYIYDWFWDPFWVCWTSPWYWGYYPHWWHSWHCCAWHVYWDRCYHWHHCHPYCSYRYASQPRPHYRDMHHSVSRREYATEHRDRSFSSRHTTATNARSLDVSRSAATRSTHAGSVAPRQGGSAPTRVGGTGATMRHVTSRDNTFSSANLRSRSAATSTRQAVTSRPEASRQSVTTSRQPGSRSTTSVSTTRTTTTTAPTRTATVTSRSATTTQSAPSRSSSSYSSSRSSSSSYSSSPRSSSSSYSGGSRSSSSYSGGSRSSSSSFSGGSRSSSSSFSGGSRSGGGFSGGSHSSGGFSGGGGRSGGGGSRR